MNMSHVSKLLTTLYLTLTSRVTIRDQLLVGILVTFYIDMQRQGFREGESAKPNK
jgi:hypothetical protein